VTQVGDWHPALVPYERGKGWLTWNYVPVGDPTVNQVATYDVRLRTASQVTIAAPGFQERSGKYGRSTANAGVVSLSWPVRNTRL